jgi:hypothetical protein
MRGCLDGLGRMGLGGDEGLGIGWVGVMYGGGGGRRVRGYLSRLSAEERYQGFIGLMAATSLEYLDGEGGTALEDRHCTGAHNLIRSQRSSEPWILISIVITMM